MDVENEPKVSRILGGRRGELCGDLG